MRTRAADGEQARNASALKWDTHLPAHVSWLEAWPEAEKQPSHAFDSNDVTLSRFALAVT